MAARPFRNRVGDLVSIDYVSASAAKNNFASILDKAVSGEPVAITRHEKPRAVVISIEEFESLSAGRESSLAAFASEFDGLLSQMQSAKAREGIAAAFAASPATLGKAAVKAAKAAKGPVKAVVREVGAAKRAAKATTRSLAPRRAP